MTKKVQEVRRKEKRMKNDYLRPQTEDYEARAVD